MSRTLLGRRADVCCEISGLPSGQRCMMGRPEPHEVSWHGHNNTASLQLDRTQWTKKKCVLYTSMCLSNGCEWVPSEWKHHNNPVHQLISEEDKSSITTFLTQILVKHNMFKERFYNIMKSYFWIFTERSKCPVFEKTLKETLNCIIFQTLWERYFWTFWNKCNI